MFRKIMVLAIVIIASTTAHAQQSAETIGDPAVAATVAKRYELERENRQLKASQSSALKTTAELLLDAPKGAIVRLNVSRFGYRFAAVSRNEDGLVELDSLGHMHAQVLCTSTAMERYRPGGYNIIQLSEVQAVYHPRTPEWDAVLMDFMGGK